MSLWTLILTALGLSADAFAVAVGKGLTMPRLSRRGALLLAAAFGLFQGLMPLIGWLLGTGLAGYIESIDHWIAFVLLSAVGGKMLRDASTGDPAADMTDPAPDLEPVTPGGTDSARQVRGKSGRREPTQVPGRELVILAVATSIDALAVGVGFALLDVEILPAVSLIALVTLSLSFMGVAVGRAAGAQWRRPAGVVGGLILIAIGTKILVEQSGLL
jgi:putative Mn2+ efflux pump MntP